MEERNKYGKATKVLEVNEYENQKNQGGDEEVFIDSSLYNKALLFRLLNKEQHE